PDAAGRDQRRRPDLRRDLEPRDAEAAGHVLGAPPRAEQPRAGGHREAPPSPGARRPDARGPHGDAARGGRADRDAAQPRGAPEPTDRRAATKEPAASLPRALPAAAPARGQDQRRSARAPEDEAPGGADQGGRADRGGVHRPPGHGAG